MRMYPSYTFIYQHIPSYDWRKPPPPPPRKPSSTTRHCRRRQRKQLPPRKPEHNRAAALIGGGADAAVHRFPGLIRVWPGPTESESGCTAALCAEQYTPLQSKTCVLQHFKRISAEGSRRPNSKRNVICLSYIRYMFSCHSCHMLGISWYLVYIWNRALHDIIYDIIT